MPSTQCAANDTHASVLWLLPASKEAHVHVLERGAALPALTTEEAALATTPVGPYVHYGTPGLSFSVYLGLLNLGMALAEPLVREVSRAVAQYEMRRFVRAYTRTEVSKPHEPIAIASDARLNQVPTQVATVELGFSVDRTLLVPCLAALSRAPYAVALHVRYAQLTELPLVASGPDVVHVDLSIAEATIPVMHDWLEDVDRACPPVERDGHVVAYGHPGKLSPASASRRRPWSAPPVATDHHPGTSESEEHAAFREHVAELDPYSKFAYA